MKEKRKPNNRPLAETITISVAEYHLLVKDHTLLEAILHAEPYSQAAIIEAAKKALGFSEAGGMV